MAENGSKISSFILEIVEEHPDDLASAVAERFGFSRQRAHAHISRQVKRGTLLKTGRTSNTKYFRVGGDHLGFSLKLMPGLAEDEVWAAYIRPMVSQLPDNVRRICAYGFTEILNNAIDHSGGSEVYIA